MGRTRRTAGRHRTSSGRRNYDLEKRRRRLERRIRRQEMKEDGTVHEAVQVIFEALPYVCGWIVKIGLVCLLAFVYVWFFGQKVSTVGDSMKPVLSNGDTVLVNRIIYNAMRPRRGDVVVFKPGNDKNSHYYIKRIIGLPGESVEIIENGIFIDGERLGEEYDTSEISDVGVAAEKVELGENEYFVLGDDRENSVDSRSADMGNVKRKDIYGKAWFVTSPMKHIGFIR